VFLLGLIQGCITRIAGQIEYLKESLEMAVKDDGEEKT
jgi:hypothetical protein